MQQRQEHQHRKGQVILEGVLLWVVIAVVLIGMAVFFQRAIRGRLFQTSNQVGDQFTAGQKYTIETRFSSARDEFSGRNDDINGTSGIGNTWALSRIRDTMPTGFNTTDIGGKLPDYKGAEIQTEDYVTATAGGGNIGTYSMMRSGKLGKAKIFGEGDGDNNP